MRLRLGERLLELDPRRPVVMGIVNATPDSFSDGGRYRGLDAQLARASQLVEAGADLIEVGGESGVTNRSAVPPGEEIARVAPLIERLAADGVLVSVDTWRGEVARAALELGSVMVNDPSGLRDTALADACALAGAALVVTHTRAEPKVKAFPGYEDVACDVVAFLRERMDAALERGLGEDQLVVDPGVDLAKTPAETVTVLRELRLLRALGRPILLAVSRKDFVGAITRRTPRARLAGTLAAIGEGLDAGASVLRVHDVAAAVDFLKVRAALRGEAEVRAELRVDERLRREEPAA
jgi:dihydropteroate synthase